VVEWPLVVVVVVAFVASLTLSSRVNLCLWVFASAPTCLYLLALTSTWSLHRMVSSTRAVSQAIRYLCLRVFALAPTCLYLLALTSTVETGHPKWKFSNALVNHFILIVLMMVDWAFIKASIVHLLLHLTANPVSIRKTNFKCDQIREAVHRCSNPSSRKSFDRIDIACHSCW